MLSTVCHLALVQLFCHCNPAGAYFLLTVRALLQSTVIEKWQSTVKNTVLYWIDKSMQYHYTWSVNKSKNIIIICKLFGVIYVVELAKGAISSYSVQSGYPWMLQYMYRDPGFWKEIPIYQLSNHTRPFIHLWIQNNVDPVNSETTTFPWFIMEKSLVAALWWSRLRRSMVIREEISPFIFSTNCNGCFHWNCALNTTHTMRLHCKSIRFRYK